MGLQQPLFVQLQDWSLGPGQGRLAPIAVHFCNAARRLHLTAEADMSRLVSPP